MTVDVRAARAVELPVRLARMARGVRIFPVGAVDEKERRRITYDSAHRGEPVGERGKGVASERDGILRSDPSITTGERDAPDCQEGSGTARQIRKEERILIQKMYLKSAFRRVGVDPMGEVNVVYVFGAYLFIGMRLLVGWRGGAGCWGVITVAI